MAIHNVAAGKVGKHNKTLVINTVDAVNFEDDPDEVQIVKGTGAAIYVTVDGSDPTVAGDHTEVLPDGPCVLVLKHGRNPASVKLISAGTPTYSVTRVA